ncbi:hypothetical protein [Streptomyces murinus]|uniref:hypothetical protein n=1 Tax=Streptomyces murinus TaxID=33900 RepID=UPI0018F3DDFA|nr:hypothetical protein [Streptomyces murinus]
MNIPRPRRDLPGIFYGAAALAALSLAWSAYAITDLMHSGRFGLSVALAGDIGWITVLWAQARGITIAGRTWAAPLAGWLIAAGVAALLVIHGHEAGGQAQAIAGPFVVIVGKIVWEFALAAMRDPAAPTAEQQAEIHALMRDAAHASALLHAQAAARIAQIRAEAEVTLARDETDFEVGLQRLEKQAELHRRTPIALPANTPIATPEHGAANTEFEAAADEAIGVIGEHEQSPITIASTPNKVREHVANKAVTSPNPVPVPAQPATSEQAANTELPSIADLVRAEIAITPNNATAVKNILAILPDANKESVGAAVRRARRKNEMEGGYG